MPSAETALRPSAPPPAVPVRSLSLAHLPEGLRKHLTARKIPCLDGVRAIAALMVAYGHIGVPHVPDLAVRTFFVLSGVLITWLLLGEEQTRGIVSLRAFYVRRSLRIFPAFYGYFLLIIVLWPWQATGQLQALSGEAIAALFYVSNYFQATHPHPDVIVSHAWSLGVEEQYYLVWPAVFVLLRRRVAWRSPVLLLLIAGVSVHRAVAELVFHRSWYIHAAFDMRVDGLLVGAWTAIALRSGRAVALWHWLCAQPARLLVTLVPLLVSSVGTTFLDEGWHDVYANVIGLALEPWLIAALLVQLIHFAEHPACRWLESRPAVWLGTLSYSMYLYQQPAFMQVNRFFGAWPLAVRCVILTGVVITAAWFSYRVVEAPFLRLKQRWSHA